MSDDLALLPCPFCDSKAIYNTTSSMIGDLYAARCSQPDCAGAKGVYKDSQEAACAAWNRRAAPWTPPATVDLPDRVIGAIMASVGLPNHKMPDQAVLERLVLATRDEVLARLPSRRAPVAFVAPAEPVTSLAALVQIANEIYKDDETGKWVDSDMIGNTLTNYNVLAAGAYRPAVKRIIDAALARYPGGKPEGVSFEELSSFASEAVALEQDRDFAGNIMDDYSLILQVRDYNFHQHLHNLVNLALKFFSPGTRRIA